MSNKLTKQDILQYENLNEIIEKKVFKLFNERICTQYNLPKLESWDVSSLYGLKIIYSYQGTGTKATVFKYFNIDELIDLDI